MNLLACLRAHGRHGSRLQVHAVPGAKQTQVLGLHDGALKIRIASPPIDGRANAVLVHWLAEQLGLSKREVVLMQGQSSRRKVLDLAMPCEVLDGRVRMWLSTGRKENDIRTIP